MIKVKWSDKATGNYHIIHLDRYDIQRLSKKAGQREQDIVTELHSGKVIETDLHTYKAVE